MKNIVTPDFISDEFNSGLEKLSKTHTQKNAIENIPNENLIIFSRIFLVSKSGDVENGVGASVPSPIWQQRMSKGP